MTHSTFDNHAFDTVNELIDYLEGFYSLGIHPIFTPYEPWCRLSEDAPVPSDFELSVCRTHENGLLVCFDPSVAYYETLGNVLFKNGMFLSNDGYGGLGSIHFVPLKASTFSRKWRSEAITAQMIGEVLKAIATTLVEAAETLRSIEDGQD